MLSRHVLARCVRVEHALPLAQPASGIMLLCQQLQAVARACFTAAAEVIPTYLLCWNLHHQPCQATVGSSMIASQSASQSVAARLVVKVAQEPQGRCFGSQKRCLRRCGGHWCLRAGDGWSCESSPSCGSCCLLSPQAWASSTRSTSSASRYRSTFHRIACLVLFGSVRNLAQIHQT